MPRGIYPRNQRNKPAVVVPITAEKPNGRHPRLMIEVEFDDADMLMSGKDQILGGCKALGKVLRLEAHDLPAVVKFTP